jgi:hypothetical protein
MESTNVLVSFGHFSLVGATVLLLVVRSNMIVSSISMLVVAVANPTSHVLGSLGMRLCMFCSGNSDKHCGCQEQQSNRRTQSHFLIDNF